MRILVTGAKGFVGKNLCATLKLKEHTVYEYDLDSTKEELFKSIEQNGLEKSRMSIFSALLRLRQICCHPKLYDKDHVKGVMQSGKFEYLKGMLEQIIQEKHRVLLFSQFVDMLDIVKKGDMVIITSVAAFDDGSDFSIMRKIRRLEGIGVKLVVETEKNFSYGDSVMVKRNGKVGVIVDSDGDYHTVKLKDENENEYYESFYSNELDEY